MREKEQHNKLTCTPNYDQSVQSLLCTHLTLFLGISCVQTGYSNSVFFTEYSILKEKMLKGPVILILCGS